MVRALAGAARVAAASTVFERARALELVVGTAARVAGVLARHADGALVLHRARAVVLATGGIGQLFARTTNPSEATGDGLALAWRAGARLADLEFVQFHPTALDAGADPMPLLTEALRGAGARARRRARPARCSTPAPNAELLPRDVVARGIWAALAAGRRAFLDAREAVGEAFPERFPTVFEAAGAPGSTRARSRCRWRPRRTTTWAASPWTSTAARASPACGPPARSPAPASHGANRLASNSLLEALVFGARVAELGRAKRCTHAAPSGLARASGRQLAGAADGAGSGRGRAPSCGG